MAFAKGLAHKHVLQIVEVVAKAHVKAAVKQGVTTHVRQDVLILATVVAKLAVVNPFHNSRKKSW